MASSELVTRWVATTRNQDELGENLSFEFHRITYNNDSSVNVKTNLRSIVTVLVGTRTTNVAGTSITLSCNRSINSMSEVTVVASANNTSTFDVVFVGF